MKKVANATDYLNMETKELFKIYSKDKNKEIRDILIEIGRASCRERV